MVVWKLRIEYENQLIEEINFDSFPAANDYIIQDKQWRGEFSQKMSYFLSQHQI